MGHFEESRAKAEAFAGKGYDLCKYGKYADALDLFRQASELDPSNFKYWYNAAVACDRIGDHVGMERASQKTIECDGTFVKGYVRLAKALVRQHKYDGAAEIVATGLLIDEHYPELLELKKLVSAKQEEISMAEARRLADQLRQQKEREKINTAAPPLSPSPAPHSLASGTASAVTAVGGNNNNNKRSGGIPASHREIPKLNNPHFADSGIAARSPPQNQPPQRRTIQEQPRQPREIPRLNNPHFGDSTTTTSGVGNNSAHPRPSRQLGQPYSRPIVPPRDIDFKDQCATFILAPNAVREMADNHDAAVTGGGTAAESAPPHPNNNNHHNRFLHQKPAAAAKAPPPSHKPTGRSSGNSYFSLSVRRSTNNNNNNHNNNNDDHNPNHNNGGGGRSGLDI